MIFPRHSFCSLHGTKAKEKGHRLPVIHHPPHTTSTTLVSCCRPVTQRLPLIALLNIQNQNQSTGMRPPLPPPSTRKWPRDPQLFSSFLPVFAFHSDDPGRMAGPAPTGTTPPQTQAWSLTLLGLLPPFLLLRPEAAEGAGRPQNTRREREQSEPKTPRAGVPHNCGIPQIPRQMSLFPLADGANI